ncbi:MAG TPA: hypothetical protein VNW54_03110 [Granulicella sp.]|jgi:hypothetical protein|nr:hypothetical protein [Granulicella sp.]
MNFHLDDQTLHLSHEQLCDHLLEITKFAETPDRVPTRSAAAPVAGFHVIEDHLRACPLCAGELHALQSALVNFREATTSFANHELSLLRSRESDQPMVARRAVLSSDRFYRKPFLWAVAAVLVVGATVGSVLPLHLHRQHAFDASSVAAIASARQSSPAPESDQALLEEVDQDLSSSVPSALEPLDDPLSTADAGADQNSNSTHMLPHVTAKKIPHE